MMRGWNRRSTNGDKRWATAAVEAALIAPFLVTLMMGMMEMSRGLMVKVMLSDAARKGCRTGIRMDKGNSDIISDATNIMRDNKFDSTKFNPPSIGSISITVTDPSGATLTDALDAPSGSVVSVQVGIPVSSTFWVKWFLTSAEIESETVVMMKQ